MLLPLVADVNIASRVVQFLRSLTHNLEAELSNKSTYRKNVSKHLNIHPYTKRRDVT